MNKQRFDPSVMQIPLFMLSYTLWYMSISILLSVPQNNLKLYGPVLEYVQQETPKLRDVSLFLYCTPCKPYFSSSTPYTCLLKILTQFLKLIQNTCTTQIITQLENVTVINSRS